MSLNYLGSLHAAKAVYGDMLARNSGHIVFVGSALSLLGACLLWGQQQQQQQVGVCLSPLSACPTPHHDCSPHPHHTTMPRRALLPLLPLPGMVGYSAYCPSKFAVRGLAECLRNEVSG
jgi:NAD(P)-dependent dehydrogenase (short-subunit alcohol dehydrogenase family)